MPQDRVTGVPTGIKTLNGQSIQCDTRGCESAASFLFRAGSGPIAAYCDAHAAEMAARQGLTLPQTSEEVLRSAW